MLDPKKIPEGDVLVVAGDFTRIGHPIEIREFNDFLGKLSHPHKLVIAGNHDLTLDAEMKMQHFPGFEMALKRFGERCRHQQSGTAASSKVKADACNAADDFTTVDSRSLLANCTYLQDSQVDIMGLKIYGTPWQPTFCDWAFNLPRGKPCLEKWNLIPAGIDVLISHSPPLGYGCTTDGFTTFINASICNVAGKPVNAPIIFDIPIPRTEESS